MLLPNGVRVVIEVDGKHHYAEANGQASPSRYGAMMGADRQLRLAGYDVYRFGADELSAEAGSMVGDFFEQLFKLHHVTVPRNATLRS
jgi:very-short-patch-repair endonuclease